MKKIVSFMVSGAVIAACAGVVAAAEPSTGSDLMNKVETQQNKVVEKEGKAKGKAKDVIKKKDMATEKVKSKKKKVKELKEGKEKPVDKMSKAQDEGEKSLHEMKDMKKELK